MAMLFCIATSHVKGANLDSVLLYEDANLIISLQYHEKASFLSRDWLSIVFRNQSNYPIALDKFFYSGEYKIYAQDSSFMNSGSLGEGNKFSVFTVFESSDTHSSHKITLLPKDQVRSFKSISSYASALLSHKNKVDLSISAQMTIRGRYQLSGENGEISKITSKFDLIWESTKGEYSRLVDMAIETCDSLEFWRHAWTVSGLFRDTNITSLISEDQYVDLIARRQKNSNQYRQIIIRSFLRQYSHNSKINEFFIAAIPTADWSLLEDLEWYWIDSFLEPLIESFKVSNDNHYKYLYMLDKKYGVWKDDESIKTELFSLINNYATEALVRNEELVFGVEHIKIISWSSWIKNLSMTHSKEAELYFKSFFNNELSLQRKGREPNMPNRPSFYPATRVCDAALEAYIYSKYGNISDVYQSKFNQLVEKGVLKRYSPESGLSLVNRDLMDRKKMTILRNALIEEYQ